MMRHYVTLCDENYLPRAMVLYKTLKQYSTSSFKLHFVALTPRCEDLLTKLNYQDVIIYPLEELLQDSTLRAAKANRTWQEFCWTMGSYSSWHVMKKCQVEVTYLDSDMAFFSDPERAHWLMAKCDIGITPHNFIPGKEHLSINGFYNVGWVTFKMTPKGYACVSRWATQCIDWCYNRNEDGKFGDQAYLNEWPGLYKEAVYIFRDPGVGLAPWNLANFELSLIGDTVCADNHPVVTYHYHEFKENQDGTYRLTNYPLRDNDIELIYKPYLDLYGEAKETLRKLYA